MTRTKRRFAPLSSFFIDLDQLLSDVSGLTLEQLMMFSKQFLATLTRQADVPEELRENPSIRKSCAVSVRSRRDSCFLNC